MKTNESTVLGVGADLSLQQFGVFHSPEHGPQVQTSQSELCIHGFEGLSWEVVASVLGDEHVGLATDQCEVRASQSHAALELDVLVGLDAIGILVEVLVEQSRLQDALKPYIKLF